MKTSLTKLLGIKYPIIQGAMAYISESKLVSAACNAGATGVIGSGGRGAAWVRSEIKKTKELTDKPFGVNLMLKDPEKDDIITAICEEKVAFVTLGAGNPIPYFKILKEAGIKVIPVVPNVRSATKVAENGADAIIIEGTESGGHIGNLTTMALMTNIIPQIDIPVVAAGGIVDGRGIAAALIMGSAGVQMGSRFLMTDECQVNQRVKEKISQATDTDTEVTGILAGVMVRGLKNNFTEKFLKLERSGAEPMVLFELATGTNRLSAIDGDIENGSVQVGQSLNVLNKIQSVEDVVLELMEETKTILSSANGILAD
ncbi:nitronate monooxygenase [Metallumcola ferriviriculae]|uniref:Probable nitronate monooxygenase n=1 Tax=Metallumcola ferriviriculae TaxID=3039180 RepID=A0AAU0UJF1_9FIRM|nr:nitronate monooxygenase [Desulfitibacteraceae bacterium MK1]